MPSHTVAERKKAGHETIAAKIRKQKSTAKKAAGRKPRK